MQQRRESVFWYEGSLYDSAIETANPLTFDDSSASTAALKFGASVFTTLRVRDQDLDYPSTYWQAHCDRLSRSIQAFHWTLPSWASVREGCAQLAQHYPVLRITIFSDGREWITGRSLPLNLCQKAESGIASWLAPPTFARSLPTHKTGNYLACWLAREEAQRQGAQEAVLTGLKGDWLETATGNLWGWDGQQWWSPDDGRCLPGIMSGALRKILMQSGQPVISHKWSAEQVRRFEAIAYSNCVVGLIPIHTIIAENTRLEYNSQHERLKALQSQVG